MPTLTYLGHRVGKEAVESLEERIRDIVDFKASSARTGLRSYLDMIGFDRFCRNFAQVAAPLTDKLSKKRKFVGVI